LFVGKQRGDTKEIRRVIEGRSPYKYRASKRDGVPLKNYSPFPLSRGRGIQGDRVVKIK
jgi:hypothetical protein